jgi:sialic acid synthase SpsE
MPKTIKISDRYIGDGQPCYTIAEIGSNFDQSIERAKRLIDLAKWCGADAVKFQCFTADKIVSKEGFENLKVGFQTKWERPVYEVYKGAEFPREWHDELMRYVISKGLHFFSAPYDKEAVDILEEMDVPVYKIGSGDITWLEMVRYIAKKGKPVILATGAATLADIDEAVRTIHKAGNENIILLQCTTNYPSSFDGANLRAMVSMRETFDCLVGMSDHTPGSLVAAGMVALGGCMIEKHFTDDKTRRGPDHPFAMDGPDFKKMVEDIRTMEKVLGSPVKDIYPEERETVILQQRCLRAAFDIKNGTKITHEMITSLRPAPAEALRPKFINAVVGMTVTRDIKKGEHLTWNHF